MWHPRDFYDWLGCVVIPGYAVFVIDQVRRMNREEQAMSEITVATTPTETIYSCNDCQKEIGRAPKTANNARTISLHGPAFASKHQKEAHAS